MAKKHEKHNVSQGVQVLNYLSDMYPSEFNAPAISKHIGVPVCNVRVALYRFCRKGKIESLHRGFYKAKIDKDLAYKLGDPPIQAHGVTLKGILQKSIGTIDSLAVEKLLSLGFEERSNKRLVAWLDWEGRGVTVVVHSGKGCVDVYVRSSDRPLCVSDLAGLRCFLDGFFRPVFPWVRWRFRRVDLNRDFGRVHASGGGCVSAVVSSNARVQVYEHRGRGLRAEIQENVDISFDDALWMLRSVSELPGRGGGGVGGVEIDDRVLKEGVLDVLGGSDGDVPFGAVLEGVRAHVGGGVSGVRVEGALVGLMVLGLVCEPVDGVYRVV